MEACETDEQKVGLGWKYKPAENVIGVPGLAVFMSEGNRYNPSDLATMSFDQQCQSSQIHLLDVPWAMQQCISTKKRK